MRISFPMKGIDKGNAAHQQSPETSSNIKNMRLYDTLDKRARGGQRPGLDKKYSQQIGGASKAVVAICSVTVID